MKHIRLKLLIQSLIFQSSSYRGVLGFQFRTTRIVMAKSIRFYITYIFKTDFWLLRDNLQYVLLLTRPWRLNKVTPCSKEISKDSVSQNVAPQIPRMTTLLHQEEKEPQQQDNHAKKRNWKYLRRSVKQLLQKQFTKQLQSMYETNKNLVELFPGLRGRTIQKDKVSWAQVYVTLIVDAVPPAASGSSCPQFSGMMDCTLELWAEINSLL